jgi:2-keto-3-deoxy-galactonokinase
VFLLAKDALAGTEMLKHEVPLVAFPLTGNCGVGDGHIRSSALLLDELLTLVTRHAVLSVSSFQSRTAPQAKAGVAEVMPPVLMAVPACTVCVQELTHRAAVQLGVRAKRDEEGALVGECAGEIVFQWRQRNADADFIVLVGDEVCRQLDLALVVDTHSPG